MERSPSMIPTIACQGPLVMTGHHCTERFIERMKGSEVELLPAMVARGWGLAESGDGAAPYMLCPWCLPSLGAFTTGRLFAAPNCAI